MLNLAFSLKIYTLTILGRNFYSDLKQILFNLQKHLYLQHVYKFQLQAGLHFLWNYSKLVMLLVRWDVFVMVNAALLTTNLSSLSSINEMIIF